MSLVFILTAKYLKNLYHLPLNPTQLLPLSFCSLVLMRLKPTLLERMYQELDLNFRYRITRVYDKNVFHVKHFIAFYNRSYWRSLITIACNLHRTRELRCLFLELSEKLIEPWRQNQWQLDNVKAFLPAVTQSVLDLEVAR